MKTVLPSRPLHRGLLVFAAAACVACAEASMEWRALAPLPDPTGFGGLAGGVIDDRVVVAGGSQWDKPNWAGGTRLLSDRIFTLSALDGTWKEDATKLPFPVGHFAAASDKHAIYLAGGLSASGAIASGFKLESNRGQLGVSLLPSLPAPIVYASGAIAGGKFYVVGGLKTVDLKEATREVWSLEIGRKSPSWRREPDLPDTGVFVSATAGVGSDLYVIGGMTYSAAGTPVPSKAVYLLRRGKWQRLADLPEARVGASSPCPVVGGRIFVVGGYAKVFPGAAREHPGFSPQTYWYEPAKARWTDGAVLPVTPVADRDSPGDAGPAPMIAAAAVHWRGHVVVVGGEVRASVRTPSVLALPVPERRGK